MPNCSLTWRGKGESIVHGNIVCYGDTPSGMIRGHVRGRVESVRRHAVVPAWARRGMHITNREWLERLIGRIWDGLRVCGILPLRFSEPPQWGKHRGLLLRALQVCVGEKADHSEW
jgi:hypothetical protein